jgi:DNA-binding response OmpR family regulator
VWGFVLAGLVALFALDSSSEKSKAAKLGPDGKPLPKPKTPDELTAEAKAAGRKEAEAEWKAKAEHEAKIRKMVRREMRYKPPAVASGGEGGEE